MDPKPEQPPRPGYLWIGLDLVNILLFRGFLLSPVHEWVIRHIWVFVWLLPILYSVVVGNLIGMMWRKDYDSRNWGYRWGMGKLGRIGLGYAGYCFILFGWMAGFTWPFMMMVDPHGAFGLAYLIAGLLGPGTVALFWLQDTPQDSLSGKWRDFSTFWLGIFQGRWGRWLMNLLVFAFVVILECALFMGPRVNPELGLGMSLVLAFIAFLPTRLLVFFLHSRHPLELLTLSLSTADLIRLMVTYPGVLNEGMGFDSIGW